MMQPIGLNNVDFSGGLGGALAGIYNAQAQEQGDIKTQQDQATLQTSQLANDRYGQMTPLELAIKGRQAKEAQAMSSPEMIEAYRKGELGELQSKEAKGKEAIDTMASNIATKLSENKTKTELNELQRLGTIITQGLPEIAQGNMEGWLSTLAPEDRVKVQGALSSKIKGVNTPAGKAALLSIASKKLEGIQQAMLMNPTAQQAITTTGMNNASQQKVAAINADKSANASKYAADKQVGALLVAELRAKGTAVAKEIEALENQRMLINSKAPDAAQKSAALDAKIAALKGEMATLRDNSIKILKGDTSAAGVPEVSQSPAVRKYIPGKGLQ